MVSSLCSSSSSIDTLSRACAPFSAWVQMVLIELEYGMLARFGDSGSLVNPQGVIIIDSAPIQMICLTTRGLRIYLGEKTRGNGDKATAGQVGMATQNIFNFLQESGVQRFRSCSATCPKPMTYFVSLFGNLQHFNSVNLMSFWHVSLCMFSVLYFSQNRRNNRTRAQCPHLSNNKLQRIPRPRRTSYPIL